MLSTASSGSSGKVWKGKNGRLTLSLSPRTRANPGVLPVDAIVANLQQETFVFFCSLCMVDAVQTMDCFVSCALEPSRAM